MKYEKKLILKPLIFGILGSLSLFSIYFTIMVVTTPFIYAVEQLLDFLVFISLLVVGFGIQVGLYSYIKLYFSYKAKEKSATSSMVAAGGISTTSMIACCAHHLTDVLPILGLSAAALFLSKYQILFMVIGVLSNLIGINIMFKIIQMHKLYSNKNKILLFFMRLNMKKALYYNISFSILVFLITLLITI